MRLRARISCQFSEILFFLRTDFSPQSTVSDFTKFRLSWQMRLVSVTQAQAVKSGDNWNFRVALPAGDVIVFRQPIKKQL